MFKLVFINFFQRLYTFDIDQNNIQLFAPNEPGVPVNRIQRLSPAQSSRIFSDAATRSRLFPSEYLVALYFWNVYPVNEISLNRVVMATDVTGTFSIDGSTCESITFSSLLRLPSGVRLDVWIYGSEVTPGVVLAYVYYWLRKSRHVLNSELNQIKLLVNFPLHVDKNEVRSHLAAKLGPPLVTSTFDSDEAICCTKQIAPQANL